MPALGGDARRYKKYGASLTGREAYLSERETYLSPLKKSSCSNGPTTERQNLTMRMHNWRFTRLTNAFSKRLDHHVAAISLHFMYVNFVRIHQTLRCTPAMAAGVTDRLWDMSDVVALLDGEREQRIQAGREKRKANNERSYNPSGPVMGQ